MRPCTSSAVSGMGMQIADWIIGYMQAAAAIDEWIPFLDATGPRFEVTSWVAEPSARQKRRVEVTSGVAEPSARQTRAACPNSCTGQGTVQ